MHFLKPDLATLLSESDVEPKFIFPLLVSPEPEGLGLDVSSLITKVNIRRLTISKGKEQKSYIPDYMLVRAGIPLMVIEGKNVGADIHDAFREARLYSFELNGLFQSGYNPVTRVIATNGTTLFAGKPDQSSPELILEFNEINIYSQKFAELQEFCGIKYIDSFYLEISKKFRPSRFWKPRRLVGGTAVQREEITQNSFGATISADFTQIFNPITPSERANIARNGYIPSKRRERYIQPIDRVIRAAAPVSETKSRTLEDTSDPKELLKVLRDRRPLEHKVLLLIGSAGSGKTTFVDYLREVALPREVQERTVWLRIDMNPAPISRSEIYDWLRTEIITKLELAHPRIDFDDLDTLKLIYSVEINSFRKGTGRLYEKNETLYNEKLAAVIEEQMNDLQKKTFCYTRYLSVVGEKLIVFVLDNCDKRLRDEQLLMFEAAQWLQKEFRGLVILPLREETYDNHQNEPPLDTALKDLVFRIEPPLFQKVLQSRVQLALASLRKKGQKSFRYNLPNGMHVEYAASDQAFYLASIMRSIFEYDHHARRLIVGLSGRNIRRALEIFLDFCTSGFIGEDEFLKIKQSQGQHILPLSLVITILLRVSQKYYDSNHSYLKNVFSNDEHDERPSYFTRFLMLKYLRKERDVPGINRLKGYVQIQSMRSILSQYGVATHVFFREIEALAQGLCIVTEDFRVEKIRDEDLVSIAPAGHVHLDMISDAHYLAAISEDTWFDNRDPAQRIADRIKDPLSHYSPVSTYLNAREVVQLLTKFNDREVALSRLSTNLEKHQALMDMSEVAAGLSKYEKSVVAPAWVGALERFRVGGEYLGIYSGKANYGIFIELEPQVVGLIHVSAIKPERLHAVKFTKGDDVKVRVLDIEIFERRISLELLEN